MERHWRHMVGWGEFDPFPKTEVKWRGYKFQNAQECAGVKMTPTTWKKTRCEGFCKDSKEIRRCEVTQ
jgi:hypothetical protein